MWCVHTGTERGPPEHLSGVDLCGQLHFLGITDKGDIAAYSLLFIYPGNFLKVLLSVNASYNITSNIPEMVLLVILRQIEFFFCN